MRIKQRAAIVCFAAAILFPGIKESKALITIREPLENVSQLRGEVKIQDWSALRAVPGRVKSMNALRLSGNTISWAVPGEVKSFTAEFWMKRDGWDGFSKKDNIFCRFKMGDDEYRLYKPSAMSRAYLETGGERLLVYPLYNWTEQPWMSASDREQHRWHYVNIVVSGSRATFYIDGFQAMVLEDRELRGSLKEIVLVDSSESGGTVFSAFNFVSHTMGSEAVRSRYLSLYRDML